MGRRFQSRPNHVDGFMWNVSRETFHVKTNGSIFGVSWICAGGPLGPLDGYRLVNVGPVFFSATHPLDVPPPVVHRGGTARR